MNQINRCGVSRIDSIQRKICHPSLNVQYYPYCICRHTPTKFKAAFHIEMLLCNFDKFSAKCPFLHKYWLNPAFWSLITRHNHSLSLFALTESRWQLRRINNHNFDDVMHKLYLGAVIRISWWKNCFAINLVLFTHFPVYSKSFSQKDAVGIVWHYLVFDPSCLFLETMKMHCFCYLSHFLVYLDQYLLFNCSSFNC